MIYPVFLEIGRMLNESLAVVPVLYGSLGLDRLLCAPITVGDIDLLVPRSILAERWALLVNELRRREFTLLDMDEHEFARDGGVHVMFAAEEDLLCFAGIDAHVLPELEDAGVRFRSLDLWQFRAVYTASSQDGYRRGKRGDADLTKVALIDSELAAYA